MLSGSPLKGLGKGSKPHHGKSRPILCIKEELLSLFQHETDSFSGFFHANWIRVRIFKSLDQLRQQVSLWFPSVLAGAVSLPLDHEQRLSMTDLFSNDPLSIKDSKNFRLSITHSGSGQFGSFKTPIIALRWTTAFLQIVRGNQPNFSLLKETRILIVYTIRQRHAIGLKCTNHCQAQTN